MFRKGMTNTLKRKDEALNAEMTDYICTTTFVLERSCCKAGLKSISHVLHLNPYSAQNMDFFHDDDGDGDFAGGGCCHLIFC